MRWPPRTNNKPESILSCKNSEINLSTKFMGGKA